MPDAEADAVLESFFAGCRKYDIYQLAEQYPNLSFDFISSIQVAVAGGSQEVTDEIRLDATNTVADKDSSEKNMGGHLTVEEAETIENNQNTDSEGGHLNVENVNQF